MSSQNDSLSIIVPAFNEEKNLAQTVDGLVTVIGKEFPDFEILIFNDFSSDRTGEIADDLKRKYPNHVVVIHNETNRGLGYNYKTGLQLARKKFVTMCPGDNENPPESIVEIAKARNQADMVIPYPTNTEVRAWHRRVISAAYVRLLNLVAGQTVRYYNGTVVHTTKVAQSVTIETSGFGYQSELIVKLLRRGHSFVELPITLGVSGRKRSAAFRVKNIISVLKTVAQIAFERPNKATDSKHARM